MPYVDLAGISTYYEQHGSGDPVLLLHGGFCSVETWQHQIDALAEHYRVHARREPASSSPAPSPAHSWPSFPEPGTW